jgi:hypothetical protein
MPKREENEYPGELGELSTISVSREWKAYLSILKRHKEYLQGEVNKFVRAKDFTEAYGALSKMDDVDKQTELFYKRIEDLKKE